MFCGLFAFGEVKMRIKGVMRKSTTGIDFAIQDGENWKKVGKLPLMATLRQFYDAILTDQDRVLLFGRVYHVYTKDINKTRQRVLSFVTPFFKVTMTRYFTTLDGKPAQPDKVNVTLEIPLEEDANAEVNA
jgi:hypothetical protein